MSFTISRCKENELSLVRLQDNATKTIITLLPSHGALLHGFEVEDSGTRYNIIDHYSGADDLNRWLALSYKSSKLSPFVCRIAAGKYQLEGAVYEFANKFTDGSAIHGLLYNKPFTISSESADGNNASVTLRYHYKQDDPGYPFEYICEIRYILLAQQTLQIETIITNLDDHHIPIADGWHPYFQLGGNINDYMLQFGSEGMLEFSEKLIPTGNLLKEPAFDQPALIGSRQLDNCFLLKATEGAPSCILHNPANLLTLSFYTNAQYPYLQVYTPDHRKSIAIENLSGAPDCFNNKMGLLMLPPRQSASFNVWYQVNFQSLV